MFATANTIKTLENNEPFYDSIPGGQSKDYLFFAHPEEGRLILTKDVLSPSGADDDIHITVSLGLDLPFNLTSKDKLTSSITFTQQNLIDLCGNNDQRCPLYIKVVNTGPKDKVYSFSLRMFLES